MSDLSIEYERKDGESCQKILEPGRRYLLGTGRQCDIQLAGGGLARRHAELQFDKGSAYIRTIGLWSAVKLNGEPVREAGPLESGDELTLGEAKLRICNRQQGNSDESNPQQQNPGSTQPIDNDPIKNKRPAESDLPRLSASFVRQFQEAISHRLDLYRRDVLDTLTPDKLRQEATSVAWQLIEEGEISLPATEDAEGVIETVVTETVGLGPIEILMKDPAVSEIMVNGHEQIYIERNGQLYQSALQFSSAESLTSALDRIVSPLGRRLDEGSPLVDARLPDGSRVNAIIPPLALNGATVTIRRFSQTGIGLNDLIELGALNRAMADFLVECIRQRRNILISGGTGTGKTTVLNALSEHIAEDERIITIEDAAELRLHQAHVVSLEARPANIEGRGAISIRDLVRNALRMRPDRILVGECRGGEALDMLQAMNTGHDGSLTTAHANTPRDALARLEVMTLMAGMDLPVRAIREQITSAIDIVIQLTRFSDGKRRITSITEVTGLEGDQILLAEIFRFRRAARSSSEKSNGQFEATGQIPDFYGAIREAGESPNLQPFSPPT